MTGQPAAPLDLRREAAVRRAVNDRAPGHGLTRASARERARVVKAVTDLPAIRQRPTPVVLGAGIVALACFAAWAYLLYGVLTAGSEANVVFWALLAVAVGALYACAWAWELYDPVKATATFALLLVTVFIAVFVIILAVAGVRGDDIDFDLPGLGGHGGSPHGGAAAVAAGTIARGGSGVARTGDALDGLAASTNAPSIPGTVLSVADELMPVLGGPFEEDVPGSADEDRDADGARDADAEGATGGATRAALAADAPGATAGATAAAVVLPTELGPDDPEATTCRNCGFRFSTRASMACPRCGQLA